jgi:hypothetical protein
LGTALALFPDEVTAALAAGDQVRLQSALIPAFVTDPTLAAWLQHPEVGSWLSRVAQRLQALIHHSSEGRSQTYPHEPTATSSMVSDDEAII